MTLRGILLSRIGVSHRGRFDKNVIGRFVVKM